MGLIKRKEIQMNPLQRRWTLALLYAGGLVAIFTAISIAFDHSLRTFRYGQYVLWILIAVSFFYWASLDLQKRRQEGQHLPWYHHPLVRMGFLFLAIVLFSFCSFDLPALLRR